MLIAEGKKFIHEGARRDTNKSRREMTVMDRFECTSNLPTTETPLLCSFFFVLLRAPSWIILFNPASYPAEPLRGFCG
jgi:hypothetical protein